MNAARSWKIRRGIREVDFDCRNLSGSLSHGYTTNLSKQQKGLARGKDTHQATLPRRLRGHYCRCAFSDEKAHSDEFVSQCRNLFRALKQLETAWCLAKSHFWNICAYTFQKFEKYYFQISISFST